MDIYIKLISSILLSILFLYFSSNLLPNIFSHRLVSAYYTFQLIVLAIYLILIPNALIFNNDFFLPFSNHIDSILFVHLTFQFSILIVGLFFFFTKTFSVTSQNNPLVEDGDLNNISNHIFIFFGFIFAIYPFLGVLESSGYFFRVLYNTYQFLPIWIGYYHKKSSRLVNIIWIGVLIELFIVGTISGSRGVAIFPLAAYVLGYISSLDVRKRRLAYIYLFIISFPFLFFMGTIGQMRLLAGRTSLDVLDANRAEEVYKTYLYLQATKDAGDFGIFDSIGRLINFPNSAVIALVPEHLPFRQFDNLLEVDIALSFNIAEISGLGRLELLTAGYYTGIMNNYGYTVNESTSVEFSIMADGWLRFGIWGAFFYGLVWAFVIIFLDLYFSNTIQFQLYERTLYLSALAFNAFFQSYSLPLFPCLRSLVLSLLLTRFLIFVIQRLYGRIN